MWLLRPLCLFGLHKRSRGRARDDGLEMVSVCRRCGRRMRKLPGGGWGVAESD